VNGEVLVFEPIEIWEVSRGGMLVETRFPLQLDSLHDFRLTLGAQAVVVKGRVVHSSIGEVAHDALAYRSGVEFVEPSDEVAAAIARFADGERSPTEWL